MIATCPPRPPLDAIQETSLRQIRDFAARIPVLKTLGFRLRDVQRGFVVFEGHVTEGLTQNGVLHGGILAAILDTACAAAAISVDFPDSYATTAGLQVSYLRSIKEGTFRAEGRCIKSGKNLLFSEASVHDSSGELLATASSQLMRIGPPALQHISILAKIKEMEE